MLYFIGLGLGDVKDITVKGLEVVRKCDRVYLEAYTSVLTNGGKAALEEFYGRFDLIEADRDLVEGAADTILENADQLDVAFLVVGDPYGATTHTDLLLRAKERDIPTKSIHNASIMNAIGCCGLQLYNFGETVSIPFWTDEPSWKPESFYTKIVKNFHNGQHTLCLLDIKVKERSVENMMRGKNIFEPPRFMSTQQAAKQLLQVIQNRKLGEEENESPKNGPINDTEKSNANLDENILCIAAARIGSEDQKLVASSLDQLQNIDMGPPLHSLIIPSTLHPIERDYVKTYANDESLF